MTDHSIESGVYMRASTQAEGVALPATTVLEYLERERRYQDVVDAADVILRTNPRDALTMGKKGAAFDNSCKGSFSIDIPRPPQSR